MGLDISHDTWHGAYSAFHRWRSKIAIAAGYPPLELMEGYYEEGSMSNPFSLLGHRYPNGDELEMSGIRRIKEGLPIKWDNFKPSPLIELLTHPDSDGYIDWSVCGDMADELEKLIPLLPDDSGGGHIGNWRDKTKQFIKGLRTAYAARENLEFG
jgi:hypothetical protein